MTLVERITEEARTLPVHLQKQVLDFILFLKWQEQHRYADNVDASVGENLHSLEEPVK